MSHQDTQEVQAIRKSYATQISQNSGLELPQIQKIAGVIPEKDRTEALRWMAWYGGREPQYIVQLYQENTEKMSGHFASFATFTNRPGK